jgi:hypothetical protein
MAMSILSRAFEASENGLNEIPQHDVQYIDSSLDVFKAEEREDMRLELLELAKEEEVEIAQSIRRAFILAMYSSFEFSLGNIAKNYLIESNSKLSMKDFSGSGYEKFFTVAKKLAVKNLYNEASWEVLPYYRDIRNLCAHNNGLCVNEDERNKMAKAVGVIGDASVELWGDAEIWQVRFTPAFVEKMNSRLTLLTRSAHATLEGN